jgi:hypothetical protein
MHPSVSSAGNDPPHFVLGVFTLAFISLVAGAAGYFILLPWFTGDGQTFAIVYPSAVACVAFAVSLKWLTIGDGPVARLVRSTVLALVSGGLVLGGGYLAFIVVLIIFASNCPSGSGC